MEATTEPAGTSPKTSYIGKQIHAAKQVQAAKEVALGKVEAGKPQGEGVQLSASPEPTVLEGEIVNRFDYTKIVDPEIRAMAQDAATRIKGNLRRERMLVLDTGKALLEVKTIKGFGLFDKWVQEELQIKKRAANNYMALARAFGDTYELVSYLPLQNLYKLAEGKNLGGARTQVIDCAQAGNPLPKREVQRLIDDAAHKATKGTTLDASKGGSKAMEAAREAVALLRERLDEDFPRFVKFYTTAGESFAVALKEAA